MCLLGIRLRVDVQGMKRARASMETTITLDRNDQPARPRCNHDNKKTTTNAGLLRIVCHQCNQVNVDFVDLADSGVLFRIARLS